MSATVTFVADPQAVLDYQFDWSTWLAVGETITAFTVTAPTGLTLGSGGQAPSQTSGKVTCWLSGGTAGGVYTVTCHITTSAGRQEDSNIRLRVVDSTGYTIPAGGTVDIDGGTP